ncbi:MAG TPA: cupin domain-containing protein [Nitrososphaerales archaeon]|nr:cupin domain-containing protein [Nitrososphaerales archaeon]
MEDEFTRPARWRDREEAWHEVMPGVKRRIVSHSTTGMMVLYRIEPEKRFPLHSHPHAQYGIFLEGGGDFKVGGAVWSMKKGDSYYIPPGVPHELVTSEGAESVIMDFFTPARGDFRSEAQQPEESPV